MPTLQRVHVINSNLKKSTDRLSKNVKCEVPVPYTSRVRYFRQLSVIQHLSRYRLTSRAESVGIRRAGGPVLAGGSSQEPATPIQKVDVIRYWYLPRYLGTSSTSRRKVRYLRYIRYLLSTTHLAKRRDGKRHHRGRILHFLTSPVRPSLPIASSIHSFNNTPHALTQ